MPQQRIASSSRTARRRRIQIIAIAAIAVLAGAAAIAMTFSGSDQDSSAAALPAGMTASDTAWTSETYSGGPRLVVDRTEISYGAVDYNQQVEAVYRLKNIGDEVVTIDEPDIKTLEGC